MTCTRSCSHQRTPSRVRTLEHSGMAAVPAEPGARQTETGREIFRGGPDDLLVPDDGLPLLVRPIAHLVAGVRSFP